MMKKLTLTQKEYDYLLDKKPNFLVDKKIVINNNAENIIVEKTKRFLVDGCNQINLKSFERVQ
jgi:hypothetical protein